ncbi:LamG domain protein jellyroll fold domain protein [Chthoniobacter flavus Ellin428]|uniref:LamG domain protein jellyroll fold domain protein n=1 Tax=Chthoniobacter flavus Ellin428 TaxID=497964 RepID=B4CU83_9BACT|nr:LamG-like jellyroll fold domain-containing protein [Chthoniobacter flavus]EDY22121.1 LamG domain protein jellyroll fold domain protein [Chthoniobacter flavus Ellin428]TCO94846.1 FecR family protein [Chthoniobacter flavus]
MKPDVTTQDLIAYLDRALSEEESDHVEHALEGDSDLRATYLQLAWERLLLQDIHASDGIHVAPIPFDPPIRSSHRFLALAAVLAVFCGLVWWWPHAAAPSHDPLFVHVTFSAGHGTVLHGGKRATIPSEGADLEAGDTLFSDEGSRAEIRFRTENTILQLAGDGELYFAALQPAKRLELRRGSLQASVAHQPPHAPLLLFTPHAQAEVIGTRFTLGASPDSTQLRVDEGAVLLGKRSEASGVVVQALHSAVVDGRASVDVQPLAVAESLQQGLLGHWTFDEGSGAQSVDHAGGIGPAEIYPPDALAGIWSQGWRGMALHLEGSRARVRTSVVTLPENLSITAWIRLSGETLHLNPLLANSADGVHTDGFRFFLDSDRGDLVFETSSGPGLGAQAVSFGQLLQPGAWHHVAAVIDGRNATAQLYLDGHDVTEHSGIRPNFNRHARLHIGLMATDGTRRFGGLIDELRVYGRSLAPAEVRELARPAAPGGG